MFLIRILFFACLLFLAQSLPISAFSWNLDDLSEVYQHPKVDSIFDSMSIREKINQLLILDLKGYDPSKIDLNAGYGGFLPSSTGLEAHVSTVNFVKQQTSMPSLIFSHLGKNYGIQLDSLIQFASPMVLSAIAEPHLLYETGRLLGKQCNYLGIHGLISSGDELENTWRYSEINQGLSDQYVAPLDLFSIYNYKDFNIDLLRDTLSWNMILIEPPGIEDFHERIRKAMAGDKFDLDGVYESAKKIVALKMWAGLFDAEDKLVPDLKNRLNANEYNLLKQELAASSITILRDDHGLFPINNLENKKIASLTIGKDENQVFDKFLENYTHVDHYNVSFYASDKVFSELWIDLIEYDIIIVRLYESEFLKSRLSGTESYVIFQEWLNKSGRCIVTYFGDPYLLTNKHSILNASSLILAYEDNKLYNSLVPQLIFGGLDADGILPSTLNMQYASGDGLSISNIGRFSYTYPEAVNLNGSTLNRIDSIVTQAIKEEAIPGCQVLVAKDSKVIFKRSYGYHTYDSLRKVMDGDLYDLASVTKVSGALPALMKLYQEGKFDLEANLGTYLKYFKRGNKKSLTFREMLAHQAGLTSYIVYWKTAIKKNCKYRRKTLSSVADDDYRYEITPGLFLHKDYKKKIYKQIRKSKLSEKKYLYSGLSFLLYPDIIEAITGKDYQDYIANNFYNPLGAYSVTYNPLNKFSVDQIVPTEYDSLFRKTQVHGTVHDEAAVMLEGVSSNAGLFANANDLAKLFQMYCNYGTYGGREYLNEETVMEFSRCQYPENDNRRGLGFDRPLPEPHINGNTAKSVSQQSFGHSGFTGTFVWVDPEYNLIYVFLSNRVYQTRANTKLYKMNVRTNIQQMIYEAMK